MELNRYKEKNHKKIGIILFTLVCVFLVVGVILYQTYAIYEVVKDKDLLNGDVKDIGNIEFLVYVDDNLQKSLPEKDSGYTLDTSTSHCENGEMVSWNNEKWSVEVKNVTTTKTKCYLYFKEIYQEKILDGAIPDLGNGKLIPITLNSNGIAYKADIMTPWYSYATKQWANAVILKDGVVVNYKPGDEIPESSIESYFVWIPRFRYQIFNDALYAVDAPLDSTKVKDIQIVFENKNTPVQNGNKKNEWLTHPAFTSFNCNGFWVGKFETGYHDATNQEQAVQNIIAEDQVIIRPNAYSWRGIQTANAFYTAYNYERELDSHLIKNMEWGAAVYLSYSEYGYVGNMVINSSNYQTGFANASDPWNTVEGEKASTTQNITGIYDMSGGTWEMVAGVMMTENREYITGENESKNSGFVGVYGSTIGAEQKSLTEEEGGLPWKEKRYYDFYEYNTSDSNYSKRILGDATGEIGPFYDHKSSWYSAHSYFAFKNYPWFIRGGESNVMFSFSDSQGSAELIITFRIALTPW